MSDESQLYSKLALDKFRQWHFWWLVIFSFLLIITFVYYLPTRFLHQAQQAESMPHAHSGEMPMVDESQPHAHDTSGNSVPLTSPTIGVMDHSGMSEEEINQHMHMDEEAVMDHGAMDDSQHAGHVPSAYHEEADIKTGLVVNLNVSPVPYNVGSPLKLDFFVNNKPGNLPVPASSLQIEHTKKIHVIGIRSDMNEFFHIHPQPATEEDAIFTVDHTFNKPGMYKIWSSIVKDETGHTFGHPILSVNGDGPKEEKKVSFTRNVVTRDYQVSLISSDTVVKGHEVTFSFDIHSLTGQEVNVEDYLGAQMHLALIKDDLSQFIHTHPEGHAHAQVPELVNVALAHGEEDMPVSPAGGPADVANQHTASGDEVIAFKVTLPEAGLYKAFAQFRPEGIDLPVDKALLAEFWIQVEEKAPFPVSQWWGLLLVSVILIAILSWVVNRYLKVRPEDVQLKKN